MHPVQAGFIQRHHGCDNIRILIEVFYVPWYRENLAIVAITNFDTEKAFNVVGFNSFCI